MTARDTLRWGVCFALVLGFHAAGAMALLARWNPHDDLVANAPVITIELAALPVAPETKPTELPPGPQQADAEPQPEPDPVKPVEKLALLPPPEPAPTETVEKLDLPPQPQVELTVMPPPKPMEKPKEPAKAKEKQKAQEKKKRAAASRQPRQRADHRRNQSRARGGANAGRGLAQPLRGAELEIATRRQARTRQALPVRGARAR